MSDLSAKPPFFELCREEPFRLFFPFGVLIGISGVSLWPLFFAGVHRFYPGVIWMLAAVVWSWRILPKLRAASQG